MLEKILLGYIAKQYSITEEQAAALLYQKAEEGDGLDKTKIKDDALTTLLSKDKDRVTALKEAVDKTELFDQAYAKAKKEVTEATEKKLVKKYGVEDEKLKLDKLVDHIVTKQVEAATAEGELTDDKIKAHPTYLALERTKAEEIETLTASHASKIKEIQDGHSALETVKTVKGKVLTYFDDLKPVLSKDGTKAANQRTVFANMFEDYEYQLQEGQTDPLVLKDGKRLEDEHGNPVTLKSLVSNTAQQYYDFAVQDPKDGPGNGQGEGGGAGTTTVPKNQEELNTAIFNAKSTEERLQIADAYEASQETGT